MKAYSELHSDLCELCPIYGQTGSDHCFEDALQYVIEMLEQEPTTKNDLGVDCISRQAVIDAINANCIWENEYNLTSSRIKKAVENLPSVTPQEPIFDKIIAEIEREIIPRNSDQYDYEAKWQNSGLRMALKVIDKYKVESEDE